MRILSGTTKAVQACAFLFAALSLAGCATSGSDSAQAKAGSVPSKQAQIAQMQIVDCLLPGQLRSLGNTTYMTPRRPIKTTAAKCKIRGGEYTAYDRANYKTALKVWMPAAQAGDAKAQVNVGQIFEEGLGTHPNYKAAVIWYKKAADQGNKRGLFNLGTMYEEGKGVKEDQLKALNLYRQAWGLPQNSVIYEKTARAERAALKKKLNAKLASKDKQVRLLKEQISSMEKALHSASRNNAKASSQNADMESRIATLKQLVDSLRQSRNQVQKKLSSIPKETTVATAGSSPGAEGKPTMRKPEARSGEETQESKQLDSQESASGDIQADGMNFGHYYALVIGNRRYQHLKSLGTPVNDAHAVGRILKNRYGFKVHELINADRLTIMKAINKLNNTLNKNDNLLIYYAGHGSLRNAGADQVGYWLPTNANPPPDDTYWVANQFITSHLGTLAARRVLVIADSCYGGLLSSAPAQLMFGGKSKKVSLQYIRYKLPRRSRLLLASGGDEPVVDSIGDKHSIFAEQLIKALRENKGIMTAPELYRRINGAVRKISAAHDVAQHPVLKAIKGAGHEVGGFFFVPGEKGTSVAMR